MPKLAHILSAATILGSLLLGAGAADAQQASVSKPIKLPTDFTPVNKSLTDLINGGAKVLAATVGMSGPTVSLMQNGKYLLCVIAPPGGLNSSTVAESECYSLN
jgi:hypothetical protein